MKKAFIRLSTFILVLSLVLTATLPICAHYVGEVINHVLYTEIKAYIDGVQIPACNVSGRMMVTAEDLKGYGFDVYWDGDARTLKVYRNEDKAFAALEDATDWGKHNPGDIVGNVLYTDIVTYLEDKPCEAFNIGGRTVVALRSLAIYGTVDYDDATHTASLTLTKTSNKSTDSSSSTTVTTDNTAKTETVDRTAEIASLRTSLAEKETDNSIQKAIKRIQLAILDHKNLANLEGLKLTDVNALIGELNNELYGYYTDYNFKLCINKNYWCFDRINKYYTDGSYLSAVELTYVLGENELETLRAKYTDAQLESLRTLMLTMYDYYEISMAQFFTLAQSYDFDTLTFVLTSISEDEIKDGTAFDTEAMGALYTKAKDLIADAGKYTKGEEQLKYIHDRICYSFSYDGYHEVHSPAGMLKGGKGVCQAYSLLFKYYLDVLGYDNCIALTSGHQWNMVKLGGNWYHIDLTWDDSSDQTCDKYFLKSDKFMRRDHDSWDAPYRATDESRDGNVTVTEE